jgi:hypothetical protein
MEMATSVSVEGLSNEVVDNRRMIDDIFIQDIKNTSHEYR